jgi:hypothetical protein
VEEISLFPHKKTAENGNNFSKKHTWPERDSRRGK